MKPCLLLVFLSTFLLSQGCSKASDDTLDPSLKDSILSIFPEILPKATYDLSLLEKTTAFESVPKFTSMQRQDYVELSGIASGKRNSGLLYTIEDSGNANRIYITNTKGEDLGAIILDNFSNRDWEDIAVGPGPDKSKTYIYVAETGDNDFKYPYIVIYRFAEPDIKNASPLTQIHVTEVDDIVLTYPEGSINAESILVDPLTSDIYVATKESLKSRLYVARYPQSVKISAKLTPLATLPFDLLTSASISANGKEILMRNKSQIWYWRRELTESIVTTLLKKPQDAPYAGNEPQGEGIGFASDDSGYYTNSEIKGKGSIQAGFSFYLRK